MNENSNFSASEKVYTYIKEGRIIEAIKILREETGLSLKEAKEFIEKFKLKNRASLPAGNVSESVIDHLRKGSKIDAIKKYREETGMGLKDSKEFIENIIDSQPDLKKQMDEVNKKALKKALIYLLIFALLIILLITIF
jgi:ribosomal protein L7/L12